MVQFYKRVYQRFNQGIRLFSRILSRIVMLIQAKAQERTNFKLPTLMQLKRTMRLYFIGQNFRRIVTSDRFNINLTTE